MAFAATTRRHNAPIVRSLLPYGPPSVRRHPPGTTRRRLLRARTNRRRRYRRRQTLHAHLHTARTLPVPNDSVAGHLDSSPHRAVRVRSGTTTEPPRWHPAASNLHRPAGQPLAGPPATSICRSDASRRASSHSLYRLQPGSVPAHPPLGGGCGVDPAKSSPPNHPAVE